MSEQCPQHGGFTSRALYLSDVGKAIKSQCPICTEEKKQQELEQHKSRILLAKQQKIATLFGYCGIPERFKTRTFDNYQIATNEQEQIFSITRMYAEHFEKRLAQGGGLVLAGKPGTGKTHLAAAIANHVIQTGRTVLFVSVLRAIRSIKECYRREAAKTEQQAIDNLLTPDLLIFDEVGMQLGSETEKLILFEILNGRYEQLLPTILISNLTEAELTTYIGARCIDRLQEGGSVSLSFSWDSYRKYVHLDKSLPYREVKPVDWEK